MLSLFNTVSFGTSFINTRSISFSHQFASIRAREAPIAELSFRTYHKPLHIKCTLLSAKINNFFIVLRVIFGGLICLYNLLRANSTDSLSGSVVYNSLHQGKLYSHQSPILFSPRSPWPYECSFPFCPPQNCQSIVSMFYLGDHMSYQVKKGQDEVMCLVCAILLIHTA